MEVLTPSNVRTFVENYNRIQEKSKNSIRDEIPYTENSTPPFLIKNSKECIWYTPKYVSNSLQEGQK